jgi:hypothetical protein
MTANIQWEKQGCIVDCLVSNLVTLVNNSDSPVNMLGSTDCNSD